MEQLVQLRKNYEGFSEAGAEVLVVFREEQGGIEGLKKAEKTSGGKFPLLLDDGGAKTKVYSKSGYDTYIIGKDGKVAAKLEGSKTKRANTEQLLETLKKLAK